MHRQAQKGSQSSLMTWQEMAQSKVIDIFGYIGMYIELTCSLVLGEL